MMVNIFAIVQVHRHIMETWRLLSMQSTNGETTNNSNAATHGTIHTMTLKSCGSGNIIETQKQISPTQQEEQHTYGIPDFGDNCSDSDDNIQLNIDGENRVELFPSGNDEAATILSSIPEAAEEDTKQILIPIPIQILIMIVSKNLCPKM